MGGQILTLIKRLDLNLPQFKSSDYHGNTESQINKLGNKQDILKSKETYQNASYFASFSSCLLVSNIKTSKVKYFELIKWLYSLDKHILQARLEGKRKKLDQQTMERWY